MSADEVLSFLAVEFSDDFGQQFLLRNSDTGIDDGLMVAFAAVVSTSDEEDRTGTTVQNKRCLSTLLRGLWAIFVCLAAQWRLVLLCETLNMLWLMEWWI